MTSDATETTPVAPTRRVKALAPERRYDQFGGMRLMAEAEGYVMMRRTGCMPCLITRKEWDSMSPFPLNGPKLRMVRDAG